MYYSTIIFEYLLCVVDILLLTKFCDNIFKRRYDSTLFFSGTILATSTLLYIVTVLIEFDTIFLEILLYVAHSLILYKGKNFSKTLYSVTFYFAYGFSTLFLLSMSSIIFKIEYSMFIEDVYLYRVLFSIVSKILIYLILVVITRKKIKEYYILCFKHTAFSVIAIMMMFFIYFFYVLIFSAGNLVSENIVLFFGVMISIMFISIIGIFKLYFDSKFEVENYKHALESIERNNQLYLRRAENNLDILLIKHDLKNILYSIDYNLEKGDLVESREIIRKLYSRQSLITSVNSGNNMLDALLEIKASDNNDILFKINTDIEKFEVDAIDLSRLLGNAIDNAIEAALRCENKVIDILIKEEYDMIYMCIKNPYKHTPKYSDKRVLSFKRNNKAHGFGMISMESIAEKYGGDLKYSFENGIASVEIYLFMNNKS